MRRKNPKRAILSFACSARQETMPHAWRSERIGRTAREPKRSKARALYEAGDRGAEKSKAAHTRCGKPDRRNRSVRFPCRLKMPPQMGLCASRTSGNGHQAARFAFAAETRARDQHMLRPWRGHRGMDDAERLGAGLPQVLAGLRGRRSGPRWRVPLP